jgi:hypothetical protein
LYDREHGFRRDPADEAAPRDLEAEIATWLVEHPGSTTNEVREGVKAGKDGVSDTLKGSDRFSYEPGPNNARLWVVSGPENHSDHQAAAGLASGGLKHLPPRRGGAEETTESSGGLKDVRPLPGDADYPASLEATFDGGHVTAGEAAERLWLHDRVKKARA